MCVMLSYVSVQPTEASGFGDTLVSRLCGDQQREGGPGRCRWRLLDERTWGSRPCPRKPQPFASFRVISQVLLQSEWPPPLVQALQGETVCKWS